MPVSLVKKSYNSNKVIALKKSFHNARKREKKAFRKKEPVLKYPVVISNIQCNQLSYYLGSAQVKFSVAPGWLQGCNRSVSKILLATPDAEVYMRLSLDHRYILVIV